MRDDFKIELFIFPDGTEVELMVFDRDERPAVAAGAADAGHLTRLPVCESAAAPARVAVAAETRVCPVCHGDLVHPVEWRRSGGSSWTLRLRCPECETVRTVEMGRQGVEELSRELYYGTQALAREAERVSRHNFEEEAGKFIKALGAGLIEPIDF